MRKLLFILAAVAFAQEGHPLTGTWHGSHAAATGKDRIDVTVVINWDGKGITGMVNPGPDAMKFKKAQLDPSNWTVHFEGDKFAIDGKIENLTNVRRSIVGTWTEGSSKTDLKLTRDN